MGKLNQTYSTFIASGCSFSSGVINNMVDFDQCRLQAFSWPHFVFLEMWAPEHRFINFALPGGGNTAALNNIVHYFELNTGIDLEKILVGFNITGLGRQDLLCEPWHPDRNYDISNKDISGYLNVSWAHGDKNYRIKRGLKETIIENCLNIIQAMTYIESKQVAYFFMFMTETDYYQSPTWFQTFINRRRHNWVCFDKLSERRMM